MEEADFIDPEGRQEGERRAFRRGFWIGVGATVGGLVLLVLTGLLVLGLLAETGIVPDSAAQAAHEIPDSTCAFLLENGIIAEGEPVHYFYSAGLFSLREDGNLFTDRRVIGYWEQDDEILIEEALYPEIAAIRPEYSEDFLEDSTVEVERADGTTFLLVVSNEEQRDRAFVDLLLRTWEGAR